MGEDKVIEYINTHLAVRDKQKEEHGEVFTPLWLVRRMLYGGVDAPGGGKQDAWGHDGKAFVEPVGERLGGLPDAVWRNPLLRWLDPANGMGNFPVVAFYRLDRCLAEAAVVAAHPGLNLGDATARRKHIIEGMLFMVDINASNNGVARELFRELCPTAVANIEQIDAVSGFLADKPLVFNGLAVERFDVIIGNPPYNSGGISCRDARVKGRVTLWPSFVKKGLACLRDGGFLTFIHPVNWFAGDRYNVRPCLLENQMQYMRIYFTDDAKRIFKGSGEITCAAYVVQKTPYVAPTVIEDVDGVIERVQLHPAQPIYLNANGIIQKMLAVCGSTLKSDYRKSTSHPSGLKVGRYKRIQTITMGGVVQYVQADKQGTDATTPKIILFGFDRARAFLDSAGEYSTLGDGRHHICGGHLNVLHAYFQTRLSSVVLRATRYRMKFLEPQYYPDIRKAGLTADKVTDEALNDLFGFTAEQARYIQTAKPAVAVRDVQEMVAKQVW